MRTVSLLQKHRRELDLLAAALLEYETLTKEEIVEIVNGRPIRRDEGDVGVESVPAISRGFTLFF